MSFWALRPTCPELAEVTQDKLREVPELLDIRLFATPVLSFPKWLRVTLNMAYLPQSKTAIDIVKAMPYGSEWTED